MSRTTAIKDAERAALLELVRSVTPRSMIEIGIGAGRTARLLLDNVPSIENYIGIDIPSGERPTLAVQAHEVPTDAGHLVKGDPRVSLYITPKGSLGIPISACPFRADVVYIDGDHSARAVVHDSALAYAMANRLILWHDYGNAAGQVTGVVDALITQGHPIRVVPNTWLAFQWMPQP